MNDVIDKVLLKRRLEIIQKRNSYLGILQVNATNETAIKKVDQLTVELDEVNTALTLRRGDNNVAIQRKREDF